jgi:hypothetical protein
LHGSSGSIGLSSYIHFKLHGLFLFDTLYSQITTVDLSTVMENVPKLHCETC